jgi:hypothetical protein
MTTATAKVEVLTAEVRVLMVGSRQVTLSVYRQLDYVPPDRIEPFGRVRDSHDTHTGSSVFVVGRDADGTLVCSHAYKQPTYQHITEEDFPLAHEWAHAQHHFADGDDVGLTRSYFHLPALAGTQAYVTLEHAVTVTCHECEMVEWRCRDYNHQDVKPDHDRAAWLNRQMGTVVRMRVAEDRELQAIYDEWAKLPLIVLAGLR